MGVDGATDEIQLQPVYWAPTPFQASASDFFSINALDVGQLKQLNIRVEGGDPGKWPLEFVDITNVGTGNVVRRILELPLGMFLSTHPFVFTVYLLPPPS